MKDNPRDTQLATVDPKTFLAFLNGLELKTLRLRRLTLDAAADFAHADVKNLHNRQKLSYEVAEDGRLRIDLEHTLRLAGPRRRTLGSLVATFSWYYVSKEPAEEPMVREFLAMVRFQTWPYVRELLQATALRANWPRLTLPLLIHDKRSAKK